MKILYISYYYLPHVGGGTWPTYNLTARLAKQHEVHLLVPNVKYSLTSHQRFVPNATEVRHPILHRTPSFQLPSTIGPFRLLGHLISTPFLLLKGMSLAATVNVIVCQYHPHHFAFAAGLLLGRIFGVPIVARADDVLPYQDTAHRDFAQRLNRFIVTLLDAINRPLVKRAGLFLCVCSEQQQMLESRVGGLENLRLSPNGVTLPSQEEMNLQSARRILNISIGKHVILFLGRFSGHEYRIDVLLKAFQLLRKNAPDCLLILAGDSARPNLDETIADAVRLTGPIQRSEASRYLAAADICVGPLGPTRALPLKIMEYMAWGKPIVTGRSSISKDVAKDGFNCVCVTPEPEAVASAISNLLHNPDLRSKLSTNARATASQFTWDLIAMRLQELLGESVRSRTHP